MTHGVFNHDLIPENVVHAIENRDAVLWVCEGFDESSANTADLRRLIGLPWTLVLCESPSSELAQALEAEKETHHEFTQQRGFVHVVAGDPKQIDLPRRALPVYLLNGRNDASDRDESYALKGHAALRRRLNMINQLVTAQPKHLVIVSCDQSRVFDDLAALWEEGFRALLTIVSDSDSDRQRVEQWVASESRVSAVDWCRQSLHDLTQRLVPHLQQELPEERLIIRVRHSRREIRDLEITRAELVEHPVLDRYEIIQSRDLRPMLSEDLSQEEFTRFFEGAADSWLPYAAGLPWERSVYPKTVLLNALRDTESRGSESNRLLYIAAESGAGGTTLSRTLAFHAAAEGFPTIVARNVSFRPDATETVSFLNRALEEMRSQVSHTDAAAIPLEDTPWFIVFDVVHWDGHERELRLFLAELTRSGRPAVVLVVTSSNISDELRNIAGCGPLDVLNHELSRNEALSLGTQLNRFLQPHGKGKAEAEWLAFWERHRPNIDTALASFWIALQFWLRGYLDLTESVQSWIYRQFKEAELDKDLRVAILEIAAASIERQALPNGILPPCPSLELPLSAALDEIRRDVPALGLICSSVGPERRWALAHDVLGRYLLNAMFFDHAMLETVGFPSAQDPTHLRLMLLERIATRSELGDPRYKDLAVEFAVKILKLDYQVGNAEFFQYWRKVLAILEHMPAAFRETSRTFNHHIAISRRRVATNDQSFEATNDERRSQLELAIRDITFALESLESQPDDDSDLNLLNSLALAYQNLADLERSLGASTELIAQLRSKADEATRRALVLDPSNSYVLETTARNLLQRGRLQEDETVQCVCEALGYIFQALSLDRSELRQSQLSTLANSALELLRRATSGTGVAALSKLPRAMQHLASAWLTLAEGVDDLQGYCLEDLPRENVEGALAILDEARESSDWFSLRMRYDLLGVGRRYDFEEQVRVLDELEETRYRMPLQLRVEHGILLYQCNRAHDANIRFQDIRRDLKSGDAFVSIPERLKVLLKIGQTTPRICTAQALESTGYRSYAVVEELRRAKVPFIPQDFGVERMPVRRRFACSITFGPNGPFIRPPLDDGSSHE